MSALSSFADEAWQKVLPGIQLSYPRDHGSHPKTQTEWWYVTGQVENSAGRRFGYQFTIFRNGVTAGNSQSVESNLKARQVLIGHFAVADIEAQRFTHTRRIRRSGAGIAGASEETMHSWVGDWDIRLQDDGSIKLSASDVEQNIAVDFVLVPKKPLVLQGDHGYSAKGSEPGNASAYSSWTHLATTGKLTSKDGTFDITGTSWFDHEYGTSQLGDGVIGWDWFGLHLEDGRDLMVYQLRNEDGTPTPYSSGTIVNKDGSTVKVSNDEYSMTRLGKTWISPKTGGKYPIQWGVQIPKYGIDFTASALVPASEMSADDNKGVTYWEGPVGLTGPSPGRGYLEMTGYVDSMKKKL